MGIHGIRWFFTKSLTTTYSKFHSKLRFNTVFILAIITTYCISAINILLLKASLIANIRKKLINKMRKFAKFTLNSPNYWFLL